MALGPMMNIARAPEAGRIFEGSGADVSCIGTLLIERG